MNVTFIHISGIQKSSKWIQYSQLLLEFEAFLNDIISFELIFG